MSKSPEQQAFDAHVLAYVSDPKTGPHARKTAGLPFLDYWHFKAARLIANSWDFADALEVIATENYAILDRDAKELQRTYKAPNDRKGCGKCDNGWILSDPKLPGEAGTARPCGCVPAVVAAYLQATSRGM